MVPPWGVLWLVLQWIGFTIAVVGLVALLVFLLWVVASFLRGALQ